MRATAFFFATDTQTYVITARHNLLPIDTDTFATGNYPLFENEIDHFLPEIDLYLGEGDSRTRHKIDIQDKPEIRLDNRVDVVGIPTDLTPEDYGYTVWSPSDIIAPDSTGDTIESVGFPGRSFPLGGDEYDTDQYKDSITNPCLHTIAPEHASQHPVPDDTGLLEIGFDTDQGMESPEYNGFSGSPVLGNGLVGIHESNTRVPVKNMKTGETGELMVINYWRADILTLLLLN